MKKTKSTRPDAPLQVGEKFAIQVVMPGENTTKYFNKMGKIAMLLLIIDRHQISFLSQKIKVDHLMKIDIVNNLLTIDESTKMEGSAGDRFKAYLRAGKELILTSLCRISDRPGFDTLMAELMALTTETYQSLPENLPLNFTSLKEIDLIRLLDDMWSYFSGPGRNFKISVASLENSPQAAFQAEPPLREWAPLEYSADFPGTYKLVATNFENPQKWRARLVNDGDRRPVDIVIIDTKFLEDLQSAEENVSNGLLIGDKLETRYRIKYDPIADKTTHEIIKVVKTIRGEKKEHQEVLCFP